MKQLMCMGPATLDTIVTLPRWPDPDDRLVVEPMVNAGGGPAATAAATAARLGRFVHDGAILAALIEGRPLPDTMRLANLAAALSCRGLDGRTAIQGLSELEAGLHSAPEPQPIALAGDA